MADYFKPWRRKIGIAVLVIACCFMGSWVRSRYIEDWCAFPLGFLPAELSSGPRGMSLLTTYGNPYVSARFDWLSRSAIDTGDPFSRAYRPDWQWEFLGLKAGRVLFSLEGINGSVRWYVVPHYFIVIPLTLVSIYLLTGQSPTQQQKVNLAAENPRRNCPKAIEPAQ